MRNVEKGSGRVLSNKVTERPKEAATSIGSTAIGSSEEGEEENHPSHAHADQQHHGGDGGGETHPTDTNNTQQHLKHKLVHTNRTQRRLLTTTRERPKEEVASIGSAAISSEQEEEKEEEIHVSSHGHGHDHGHGHGHHLRHHHSGKTHTSSPVEEGYKPLHTNQTRRRLLTTTSDRFCLSGSAIRERTLCETANDCSKLQPICLIPNLPSFNTLVRIHTRTRWTVAKVASSGGRALRADQGTSEREEKTLFVGYPEELFESVTVSDYSVRWKWLRFLDRWDVPGILERFFRYLFSISAALAIVNMAPVFHLDGEHCMRIVCEFIWPGSINRSHGNLSGQYCCTPRGKEMFINSLLWMGSILLVANIIGSLSYLLT